MPMNGNTMNETAHLRCDTLAADGAFGPIIDGCRRDFTFTFEQYIFSIVPSVIFLLVAPMRINALRKRQTAVGGKPFRSIKLIAIGLLAILQLAIVILWATTNFHSIRTPAAIASSVSFITSILLLSLSYLEHSKSLRPSFILNVYLLFAVLFDIVVLRTLWTALPGSHPVRDLFTASFALKAVVFFLEAKEKRSLITGDRNLGPEETTGLYNESFVWWLNSIIKQGYRKVLGPSDLYTVDERMFSETLNEKFWKEWKSAAQTSKPSLTKVIVKVLRWELIVPIFPRLALLGFAFCQPLLVGRLLQFLQNQQETIQTGYGLIGAYAVVYFGMSVSTSLFMHRSYKCLTMLRGTLVSAVYTKTTEISITALDNSAAVSLMSTDVERLILGLRGLHDIWANMLQFALATWLLESRLGWACVGPIIVIICAASVTVGLAFVANTLQMQWLDKIQRRVGDTANMLGHMKGIKMLGLSRRLHQLIQTSRVAELKDAQKFWVVQALVAGLAFAPETLSPVATFAFYAVISSKTGETLDAPRLFTSLSLLILLTQPLFKFFADIMDFKTVFGCVERIEKFLTAETRSDHRLHMPNNETRSRSSLETHDTHAWQTSRDDIQLMPAARQFIPDGSEHVSQDVLRIESGTFAWNDEENPVLQNIETSIARSQLTMLIGPVASGKSTLLKAILGETKSSKGFVYIQESEIAYCEQTPWLINASVRDNIIGFSRFDQALYDSVVYCCDLNQDISTFPKQHDTVVGSKGISLSTGQKHRIAIARAVYSKKTFAIFDDVFSGLDVNTQKNVFTRLFGPDGLLRKWKTTVLIATHAVNLLPFSDKVIALSSTGTIAEQGTFKNLNAVNGYVHQFYVEHSEEEPTTQQDDPAELTTKALPRNQSAITVPSDGDKSRQMGDWAVYKYYFGTIGAPAAITFLTLGIMWAVLTAFPVVWLKWYADANAREPNKHNNYYLGVYTALQIAMLLDIGIFSWFTFCVIAKKSGVRLHDKLLKKVMLAPMSFFSQTDIGSITTRFSQDISLLDSQLPMSLIVVTGGFLSSFAQIGLIASAAHYIAIAFPFLFAVYFFIQRYYLRTSRQIRFLDLEEKAPVYTQFIESLSGLATIRAFGWKQSSILKNHSLVDKSQKPFYMMYMIQTWLSLVLDLVTCALAILVVGISVRMRSTISVGFTGVSLTQIISFTGIFKTAIMFWTHMETSIGAVARIKQFESETADENLASEHNDPPPDWPSKGGIEIENLTVSYGIDNSRKALSSISLSIPPGSKLAILGRTGSGKSTLLLALFRMIEISSGRILIDDLDITTIPRNELRLRLNAIGEDPYFISGTVRLNLDPYDPDTVSDAKDTEMRRVLEKLGLWDVVSARGGLGAEWSDELFSHGQVQMFSLARALMRRDTSSIVVMDEVTSSVDRETDERMQKVIREEFEGKTLVTIAHRVETVRDYDLLVVLGGGEVVEVGKPEEMMVREGGVFGGVGRA
ncbi:multidrug resistance-like protein [Dendryphion nanum]|uniref:Multidrug resistance-like protein n=1 Tax=Dendryphion nanum TaxID=256645 RepID=A0A9P9DHI6_9PLEO|nr:multidrug resistance-like protein [Dendryphion nanum]